MKQIRNQKRVKQRGYALLVTLVLLSLLGVILGGMARRSADTALQARDAEQTMRLRWAELSCCYTLLSTAPKRQDNQLQAWQGSESSGTASITPNNEGLGQTSLRLYLAGLELWARIDDEQAKINLNERLHTSPDAVIMPAAVVDQVLSPARSSGARLTRPVFVETLGLKPVMSWQQVLPNNSPEQLLGINQPADLNDSGHTQAVAGRVTLWGEGEVNFWTASDQVVRRRLQGMVSLKTVEALLRLRQQEPRLSLGIIYENTTEDREERAVLEQALTEKSDCYSMWLAIRPAGREQTNTHWSLRVLEKDGDQESGRISEYRW